MFRNLVAQGLIRSGVSMRSLQIRQTTGRMSMGAFQVGELGWEVYGIGIIANCIKNKN